MQLLKNNNNNKNFFYDCEFSDASPCEYEEYRYSLVQFNQPEPVLGLYIIGRKMHLGVALHWKLISDSSFHCPLFTQPTVVGRLLNRWSEAKLIISSSGAQQPVSTSSGSELMWGWQVVCRTPIRTTFLYTSTVPSHNRQDFHHDRTISGLVFFLSLSWIQEVT